MSMLPLRVHQGVLTLLNDEGRSYPFMLEQDDLVLMHESKLSVLRKRKRVGEWVFGGRIIGAHMYVFKTPRAHKNPKPNDLLDVAIEHINGETSYYSRPIESIH